MTWTLNEIEAEAKKAIRGAGLPWGIAEEGAKAVRWFAANGIDALPALADLLDRHAGQEIDTHFAGDDLRWHGRVPLCPLLLGAAISDRAYLLTQGLEISAMPAARPLLLVPFVARAARMAARPLMLVAEGCELRISAAGTVEGPVEALDMAVAACIKCTPALASGQVCADHRPAITATLDSRACERIEHYAARTYVPASEQSRRLGAGAGTIDND